VGDKKRIFLAVTPAIATTRKIAEATARMRAAAEKKGLRVGWVPPANLHVTLKFLGWAPADVVVAVRDRVREVTSGVGAFELAVRGAGACPTPAAARVLWVGAQDASGTLARLAASVETAMAALGFAPETRTFSAHVTVGRVKEGTGADEVLAPFRQTDFGTSLIRDVVLYESLTKSSGSEYIELARLPLSGPPDRPERQTRAVKADPERERPESEDPNGGQP
jgi:RNA 2',3'-cyclic 3'-phosphodiesterase